MYHKPEMRHEFSIEMCYETIDIHLARLPERFQGEREDLRQDIVLAVMEHGDRSERLLLGKRQSRKGEGLVDTIPAMQHWLAL